MANALLTHPSWPLLRPHLKRLRNEKGLTLEQVAEAAGVSSPGVWRVENGGSAPSLQMLLSLLDALGVRPSAFFALAEHQAS